MQAEAASARSRKTFFAKNVVGLMLQPLTLTLSLPAALKQVIISLKLYVAFRF